MRYKKSKKMYLLSAMTLVELVVALAIMAIIFAIMVPQFSTAQRNWDAKEGLTETIQNARVLMDHLNQNLSKAALISSVSSSSEPNGFIQFQDNDGNTFRYDIASNYVEFGLIGSLSDLAGPASQLQFTCYALDDFNNPTTDGNSIRMIRVQSTLTNASAASQDKTFTTQVFLSTNGNNPVEVESQTLFEYDTRSGKTPSLAQIDSSHFLCAYTSTGDDGWAVVLTVDTNTWTITKETAFEFATTVGKTPALAQIDSTHYLCTYEDFQQDGWTTILTVDTSTWTITQESSFEFDSSTVKTPDLVQIDSAHYLCVYEGFQGDGWATVLTVDSNTWTITNETPFEYDTQKGATPALSQLDSTHFLCAYSGDGDDGWATVLTVDPNTWNITNQTPFEFDNSKAVNPALVQIDSTHYLCGYNGDVFDGWSVVLTVNTSIWTITAQTPFEFDISDGREPALYQINSDYYLCAYSGPGADGWATVLKVDNSTWQISQESSLEFDTATGQTPDLAQVDGTHYLCVYDGDKDDGWAVILETIMLRP